MSPTALRSAASYPAIVGRILVHLRKKREWTQADLVAASGLSSATLSRLESGHIPATLEQLGALAVAFETTPSQILQLADEATQSLRDQGIEVKSERLEDADAELKKRMMVVAGLALGALVVAGIAAALEERSKASRTLGG